MDAVPDTTYRDTRRCLHGLAELVLSGPRFRQTGELRLRVRPDGIGTWDEPVVALRAGELVTVDDHFPVHGLSIAQVAERAGLVAGALDDVYRGGPHVDPSDRVELHRGSVRVVEEALSVGDEALRRFHPPAEPILWPEHFDVAISVDQVNFGVSPGDEYENRPYAYVGPHHTRPGDFWNAPFGASRLVEEFADAGGVVAFFREGARRAAT
jgi:hypothetical protein